MQVKKYFIPKIIITVLCLFNLNAHAQLSGLVITGTPDSPSGATWTYNATIGSVVYDLKGLIYKPLGTGNFPAVIINHGTGGNTDVNGYSDKVAKEMVTWGYVTIATNYCHMGTSMAFPCGSPGVCTGMTDWGASSNNFLRAMKVWDILASLTYVDTNCIATFGHSRGSFLTTGLAANYPDKFNCAGHTDGGVAIPDQITMPTLVMANDVVIPYILHHGELTVQVPLINDDNFDSILTQNGVIHDYYVYTGYVHSDMPHDSLVYVRTQTFFNQYICNTTTGYIDNNVIFSRLIFFPNPASIAIQLEIHEKSNMTIYNFTGQIVISRIISPKEKVDISNLENGVYFISLSEGEKNKTAKLIIAN